MKVDIGLIGFGTMGKNYARILKKLNNLCNFVAISDTNKNLKFEAENYATFYLNYEEMLKNEKLEAVCIVIPPSLNVKVAKTCIEFNIKNILIEKPLTTLRQIKEGYELIKIAEKEGTKIMVGDIICYDSSTIALKNNIKKLGKIKAILTLRFGKYPFRFLDVGVNEDLLIHDLTFARYILDWQKFYLLNNIKENMFRENQIDYTTIEAISETGVKLISSVTWLSETKIRLAIVVGEEKIAQVNFLDENKYVRILPHEIVKIPTIKSIEEIGEVIEVDKTESLERELIHFIEVVQNKREILTTPERHLETLEILYPTIF